MPVVSYEQVTVELPKLVATDLSTDQQHLYEICVAVPTGVCTENLSRRDPDTLSHSRWLTAANRILCSYLTEHCRSISAAADFGDVHHAFMRLLLSI